MVDFSNNFFLRDFFKINNIINFNFFTDLFSKEFRFFKKSTKLNLKAIYLLKYRTLMKRRIFFKKTLRKIYNLYRKFMKFRNSSYIFTYNGKYKYFIIKYFFRNLRLLSVIFLHLIKKFSNQKKPLFLRTYVILYKFFINSDSIQILLKSKLLIKLLKSLRRNILCRFRF